MGEELELKESAVAVRMDQAPDQYWCRLTRSTLTRTKFTQYSIVGGRRKYAHEHCAVRAQLLAISVSTGKDVLCPQVQAGSKPASAFASSTAGTSTYHVFSAARLLPPVLGSIRQALYSSTEEVFAPKVKYSNGCPSLRLPAGVRSS